MADADLAARDFDTDTIAPEFREAAYLAEIDHALATVFLTEPIHARLKARFIGSMRVIALDASARRSERTSALIARDRHDGISLQLATAGTATGHAAGRAIESKPGTIMLLDFAQPFCVTDQSARTVINLNIPRATLAARMEDVRAVHGRVLDPGAGAMLAAQMRELPTLAPHMPPYAAAVLCDIVVNLLLLALDHDPSRMPLPSADRRTTLFERAALLVDHRLASSDLTPEWLVAKLNVSRSELYAAFDTVGGIARFIWRRRLDGAYAALTDAHDTRRIGEIAFASGFSSEAHFSRAFRNAFGCSPSDARRTRVPI